MPGDLWQIAAALVGLFLVCVVLAELRNRNR